jgi:hypothetical protein
MTLLFLTFSFLAGVAVGALAYRKNASRAQAIEAKAKHLADEFRK